MSTDRDVTRIVRSWLEEGVTALPDRVLDSVLDQLPAHRQRRRPLWWPRREYHMNALAKTAIAAAAVLVVAILAYKLLPSNGGVGGPTPSPIVTPTPSPTAPPEVTVGSLAAGTYSYSYPDTTLTPFTVTVPNGWAMNSDGFISKGVSFEGQTGATGVALASWLITHVYADSCQWQGTLREAGSRQLLATGLAEQTGHTTSGPTDVTLGGHTASRLVLSVAADFDRSTCQSSVLRLWPDPGPDENGGHRIYPGQTTTVYAIEDSGKAMVVFTVSNDGSAAGDVAELQAILDSIHFLP